MKVRAPAWLDLSMLLAIAAGVLLLALLIATTGCHRRQGQGPDLSMPGVIAADLEACPADRQLCFDAGGGHPKIYKAPPRGTPSKVCCVAGTCYYVCPEPAP